MASTLVSTAATLELTDDERAALLWLTTYAAAHAGVPLRTLAFLATRGGALHDEQCAAVQADVASATPVLATPLEAWQPKYMKLRCLFSDVGMEFVRRHQLRYLNRNVDPPAVFAGSKRTPGAPQTLADVPELRRALATVTQAVAHAPVVVTHTDAYESL